MTSARGAWISLPGWPAASATGRRARPVERAVIRTGTTRSTAPRTTAAGTSLPRRSCSRRMRVTTMMPLRVAMPKSEMKPMRAAIDRVPPPMATPTTPPMRARGRLIITMAASRGERRALTSSRKMPTTAASPSRRSTRAAEAWASNCPSSSTR